MDLVPLLLAIALIQNPAPSQASGSAVGTMFEKVFRNWTPNCDAAGIAGHRIAFDLTLDPDGRIVAGPTVVRPQQDPDWQAAAETARRALIRSAPFDVPPDFTGGAYRPTFRTDRACARPATADED